MITREEAHAQLRELNATPTPPNDIEKTRNENQQTLNALFLKASCSTDSTIVVYLLENGANIDAKTPSGQTSLHFAASCGHVSTVRELLAHGADPHAVNSIKETPVVSAAERGRADVVKLLLKKGASIGAEGDATTPLHAAAQHGKANVVKLLLKKGANPNAQDQYGYTPLCLAVSEGWVDAVKLLLEHGADLDIASSGGNTPLERAHECENEEMIALLEAAAYAKSQSDSVETTSENSQDYARHEGDFEADTSHQAEVAEEHIDKPKGLPDNRGKRPAEGNLESVSGDKGQADDDSRSNKRAKADSETESAATATPEGNSLGDASAVSSIQQSAHQTSEAPNAAADPATGDTPPQTDAEEAHNSLEERHASSVANATNPFIAQTVIEVELFVSKAENDFQTHKYKEVKEDEKDKANIELIISGDAYTATRKAANYSDAEDPLEDQRVISAASKIINAETYASQSDPDIDALSFSSYAFESSIGYASNEYAGMSGLTNNQQACY